MFQRMARMIVFGIVMTVAACGGAPETVTPEPPAPGPRQVETESDRDGVFTIEDGQREQLPAPNQTVLEQGDGVDVDADGRAILRFEDLLTVELLRDGELTLQQLDLEEQSAFVTVAQRGGALINNFSAEELVDKRFTVQSEFATIEATGTQFLIVKEANSPLEWIVAMDANENDLTVTADGVTKSVSTGMARWIAPIGEPSAGIDADMSNVDAWIQSVRAGQPVAEIGERVWAQADVIATPDPLATLPAPGEAFELEGVQLTLDPEGLFGDPSYALEDCNNDGQNDIAMQGGRLTMDFRGVLNRVRAVDVTVLNRAGGNSGSLRVMDPAREQIALTSMDASAGSIEVLSLRSDQPYHYAELAASDGCFLGFSLTPPQDDGTPGEPRPVATAEEEEEQVEAPVCTVIYPGSEGLNFRSGPGTEYTPPIATLYEDTRLTPLGRNQAGTWLFVEVQDTGQQGWVSASEQFVSCTVDITTLPVRPSTPITPTPTTEPETDAAIQIESPAQDAPQAIENGFTLIADGRVPAGTQAWLVIETAAGDEIQEQELQVVRGTAGYIETDVVVDYSLPADIRVWVQVRDADTGDVLAEDSVLIEPLFAQGQVQRPRGNGWMPALPVGANAHNVGMDIDGSLGEWNALLEESGTSWTPITDIVFDSACRAPGENTLAQDDDLRGQVAFAYDQNFLYVAFVVADTVFESYDGGDTRIFLGDAPQLLLDMDLTGDFAATSVNEDDLQVDLHPGALDALDDVGNVAPHAAIWQLSTLDSRIFAEARVASSSLRQGGYILEASLPWTYLRDVQPAAGDRFGLVASISDNDTPNTDQQECMISTAPQRDWSNPTTWGTLVLTQRFIIPELEFDFEPPLELEPAVPFSSTPVP